MIVDTDILIIGGGPAGLAAATVAIKKGAKTVLVDDSLELGGQLVKQTHKFFGSEMEYAGVRGIDIPKIFLDQIQDNSLFTSYSRTSAMGIYDDNVVTALEKEEIMHKFRPKAIIVATGAREKMIPFPNNDLPGIYGAGAVQTLMNVHGVKPGENVLMVGAGNIGLIVSYQLLQAGVNVEAVIEGMDRVGGYWVHASKIRRLGIPIHTRHTILEAIGDDFVEAAIIAEIDENWQVIHGTKREVEVDTICLAVGLAPLSDFFYQTGCDIKYIRELSGDVPVRDKHLMTTKPGLFVAGDSAGIEEASSAMIEGFIAGEAATEFAGIKATDFDGQIQKYWQELHELRSGPVGQYIRNGIQKVQLSK
ncbi:MAG: NAD(P)/FAD-dependent oxidoreductase [Candidatus Zixiibacteriota bacterium]